MESTQRLDYSLTQELRGESEQVGFLGICGNTYPINMGPNSIGRDPEKCDIVLDAASISRQHAVIHVLSKHNFMLMDVGSANGTKMAGRTLPRYISHPLKNGTLVQFGDLFGYFRLLEEKEDLPMTQVTDIPDTPVSIKHVSRINAITTVPESPDVSDKDDSFIVPSQPKGLEFPSTKTSNFIKPGRTISIQPVGSSRIDNVYWNSSKKSTSLELDNSNASLNDSIPPVKLEEKENKLADNINELETQMFQPVKKSLNDSIPPVKLEKKESKVTSNIHELETQMFQSTEKVSIHNVNNQLHSNNMDTIHTVDTQIPVNSPDEFPSIHSLNTQMPGRVSPLIHNVGSSSIYNANTQLFSSNESPSAQSLCTRPGENLPEVQKIIKQQDMQFDLCLNNSIHNADTQIYLAGKENVPVNSRNNNDSPSRITSNKLDASNDEVLFDKVDDLFEEQFESQTILTEDIDLPINKVVEPEFESLSQIIKPKSAKRNMRIASDEIEVQPMSQILIPKSAKRKMRIKSDDDVDADSTDCEDDDILLTQDVLKTKTIDDGNIIDNMIELKTKIDVQTATNVDFEDMPTQVLDFNVIEKDTLLDKDNSNTDFEDMPTQVLHDVDVIEKDAIIEKENPNTDLDFADMPTQILDVDVQSMKQPKLIEKLVVREENSPFKIPLNSALKVKKKEGSRTPKIKPIPFITNTISKEEINQYYEHTQDILDDLCTQRIDSVQINSSNKIDDEKETSKNKLTLNKSVISIDDEEEINVFVKNVSKQDVLQIIGVDNHIEPVKKVPSDGSNASDVDTTPKKQSPFKIMNIDLPNSQEISSSLTSRAVVTESSSESETEINSEEQCTPIVFRKKNTSKSDVILDLTKKFDIEALPSRVITRVRKPTAKFQNETNKKTNEILKPKIIPEPENGIDKDIITENISRLKSKNDKVKNTMKGNSNNDSSKAEVKVNAVESRKRVRSCRKKAEEIVSKTEVHHEKVKDSIDDSKTNGKRKREPINTKKELLDSKNQSANCDKITNSSIVEIISVDSKDRTHANKNKIETHSSTNSQIETKRSSRSRNAKTKTRKKSPSPVKLEKDSQQEKSKRKRTEKAIKSKPQKEENKEPSPEKEIRRSKRQKLVKEEVKNEPSKSILKRSVTELSEHSTVYNMSSSSNSDSCSKRPSLNDSEAPVAKRPRSGCIKKRATPTTMIKTQYVLFTAFPFDSVKYTLKELGAVVVTDVLQSTVLLTKQIKRTFKLLCAVGLGKPIVGPDWVNACTDSNAIVDPWQYLMKDETAEKRFHFSLEQTLKGKRNFLHGYNVSSTPKVMPDANEMKLIVECSGGRWQEGGDRWVCVSVPADRALWPALRARGAALVSTEFILGGVLRQRLDIHSNVLK